MRLSNYSQRFRHQYRPAGESVDWVQAQSPLAGVEAPHRDSCAGSVGVPTKECDHASGARTYSMLHSWLALSGRGAISKQITRTELSAAPSAGASLYFEQFETVTSNRGSAKTTSGWAVRSTAAGLHPQRGIPVGSSPQGRSAHRRDTVLASPSPELRRRSPSCGGPTVDPPPSPRTRKDRSGVQ